MIGDREYDAEAGISKATLTTAYELKVRTGIGMKTLAERASKLGEFKDATDVLEDKDAFQAFRIIIWLARKHAGEKNLSLDDATDFSMDDFRMVVDEDEQEPEPDPKADSVAGENAEGPTTPTT